MHAKTGELLVLKQLCAPNESRPRLNLPILRLLAMSSEDVSPAIWIMDESWVPTYQYVQAKP